MIETTICQWDLCDKDELHDPPDDDKNEELSINENDEYFEENEADMYEASLEEERKYVQTIAEEYDRDHKTEIENSRKNDGFIPERSNHVFTINVFDDGNEKYKDCKNEWSLSGRWRGKVSLVNKDDPDIKIYSISAWKVIIYS